MVYPILQKWLVAVEGPFWEFEPERIVDASLNCLV